MKFTPRSLLLAAGFQFALSLPSTSAAIVLVDFNGTNPTSTLFNTMVPSGSTNYGYWANNTGVLDQPGPSAGGAFNAYNVDRDTPGTVASPTLQYKTAVSTTGMDSFTVSGMIKGDFVNLGNGVTSASLGFMQFEWTDFTSATSYIAMKLIGDGTGVRWNTSLWGVDYVQTGTISLNSANWYLTSATFTKSSTVGTWNWSTEISDYGTAGTTFGSLINSASGSFIHSETYNSSSLYAGVNIAATSINFNSTNLDNFTVISVPEPTTLALCFGALALMIGNRSRRHRTIHETQQL